MSIITAELLAGIKQFKPDPAVTISFEAFESLLETAEAYHAQVQLAPEALALERKLRLAAEKQVVEKRIFEERIESQVVIIHRERDRTDRAEKVLFAESERADKAEKQLAEETFRVKELQDSVMHLSTNVYDKAVQIADGHKLHERLKEQIAALETTSNENHGLRLKIQAQEAQIAKLNNTLANTREAAASLAESNRTLREKKR